LTTPLTETRPERTAAATRARDADEGGEEDEDEEVVEAAAVEAADRAPVEFETASRDDRNVSSLSLGGLSDKGATSGDVAAGETSDRLTRKVVGGTEGEGGGGTDASSATAAASTSSTDATRAETKRRRCCCCCCRMRSAAAEW